MRELTGECRYNGICGFRSDESVNTYIEGLKEASEIAKQVEAYEDIKDNHIGANIARTIRFNIDARILKAHLEDEE